MNELISSDWTYGSSIDERCTGDISRIVYLDYCVPCGVDIRKLLSRGVRLIKVGNVPWIKERLILLST